MIRHALLLLVAFALAGVPVGVGASQGSVFAVTKAEDTQDGVCDADCSLREAIDAANSSPGADHVVLPEGDFLINLDGVQDWRGIFTILDDLTISGAGADRTIIDGNLRGAVVRVLGAYIEIRDLTIRRGLGAIWATAGATVVERVILRDNESTSGGGIFASGTLTVTDSTIANNIAGEGGGLTVHLAQSVQIVNTTISSNRATSVGGGIFNWSAASANYRVVNSTVTGNIARGGSTGGVVGFEIVNSIVAGNDQPFNDLFGPAFDCGTVHSLGHNIDGDGSCGLSAEGDQPNTNPLLGPLSDNGGPTQTHALLPGSPAIDVANNAWCPDFDQRGALRPYGPQCDIGAYEAGDDAADRDGDGISDNTDSCIDVANPEQADTDGDGFGDLCDSVPGDTDCDGDADSVDALAILRSVAGLEVGAQCLAATGDVNCSSIRDAVDALAILRYVAALPVSLPAGCPPVGPP